MTLSASWKASHHSLASMRSAQWHPLGTPDHHHHNHENHHYEQHLHHGQHRHHLDQPLWEEKWNFHQPQDRRSLLKLMMITTILFRAVKMMIKTIQDGLNHDYFIDHDNGNDDNDHYLLSCHLSLLQGFHFLRPRCLHQLRWMPHPKITSLYRKKEKVHFPENIGQIWHFPW